MSEFSPKAHIGSAVIKWVPYYRQPIQSALDGQWKSGQTGWGVKENAVDMVSLNASLPDDVKQLVADRKAALAESKAIVFAGPSVDQSGKEMVAAGKEADIGMLNGMNFYVKGVIGGIPQ